MSPCFFNREYIWAEGTFIVRAPFSIAIMAKCILLYPILSIFLSYEQEVQVCHKDDVTGLVVALDVWIMENIYPEVLYGLPPEGVHFAVGDELDKYVQGPVVQAVQHFLIALVLPFLQKGGFERIDIVFELGEVRECYLLGDVLGDGIGVDEVVIKRLLNISYFRMRRENLKSYHHVLAHIILRPGDYAFQQAAAYNLITQTPSGLVASRIHYYGVRLKPSAYTFIISLSAFGII